MTAPAPSSPELALRDAIRTALKADARFTALAAKRIFDEVPTSSGKTVPLPTDPVTPYAYIGPMGRQRNEFGCGGQVVTVRARLYAVSTSFNRDQGWKLIDAMATILDMREQDTLPLAAPYSLQKPIEVTQAGDVIDPLQAKSVFLDLTTIIARDEQET